jgi:hypothetical protein
MDNPDKKISRMNNETATKTESKLKMHIKSKYALMIISALGFASAVPFVMSAINDSGSGDDQVVVIAAVVEGSSTNSALLSWSAPGDDGGVGSASAYDIRYSTSVLSDGNFSSATAVSSLPTPKPANSSEQLIVSGLTPATTYHFALKARDEAGNWSVLSNVASVRTRAESASADCVENWTCEEWSACIDGSLTRACTDQALCGTVLNRPSLSQVCSEQGGEINPNTVDSVAPNAFFVTRPTETVATSIFTFSWSALDDVTILANLQFSYKLDSQPWSDWSNSTSATLRRLRNGDHQLQVRVQDEAGNTDPSPATSFFRVQQNAFIAVGVEEGGSAMIRLFTAEQRLIRQFSVFESSYRGGLSFAVGDLGDDGHDEIVVAPGAGRTGEVRILRSDGSTISSFTPFGGSYSSGINVILADLSGDGKKEIVVAPRSGEPRIRIFGFQDGRYTEVLPSFFAYSQTFKGGISLAAADVDGDSKDEIATLPFTAGGPNLRVFGLRNQVVRPVALSVDAFAPTLRTGYTIAAGDIHGDGKDEVFASVKKGSTHVRVLGINRAGKLDVLSPGFFAFGQSSPLGTRLSCVDTDKNGSDEVLISVGTAATPNLTLHYFNGKDVSMRKTFSAFPSNFRLILSHVSGIF